MPDDGTITIQIPAEALRQAIPTANMDTLERIAACLERIEAKIAGDTRIAVGAEEAAALLSVSVSQLATFEIPRVIINDRIRYRVTALEKFAREHEQDMSAARSRRRQEAIAG